MNVRGTSSRHVSKRRMVLSFASLFILSFIMWFILILVIKYKDETHQMVGEAKTDGVNLGILESQHLDQQPDIITEHEIKEIPSVPLDYSPGLVVLSSTNGADRTAERNAVFDALCTGQNAELLRAYKFQLYLSVDSINPPKELSLPLACKDGKIPVTTLHQPSPTDPGFPSSPTGRISAHYKFAMKYAFQKHSHVIFLEDDLVPAHDFVWLFVPGSLAFQAFHNEPRKVWCVSAWNDMGVQTHASDQSRLFRTDFFPGLGWMTSRSIFDNAIKRKWSDAATTGWDNWLRSNNDEERVCVVPEVNRVRHISKHGVNVNDPENKLYGVYSFPAPGWGSSSTRTQWTMQGGVSMRDYADEETSRLLSARRVDYYKTGQMDISRIKQDVLLVYERSQYADVLGELGANPPMKEPRAGRIGMISLRRTDRSDAYIFLCDLVRCANRLFPMEQLVKRTSLMLPASKGKSCTAVCGEHHKKCDPINLQTISYPPGKACLMMRTHFDCKAGCGHQVGDELPALVVGGNLDTNYQCLTGESAVPKCDAAHPATKRLCSCVDP